MHLLCWPLNAESRGGTTLNKADLEYYLARIAAEEIAAQRAASPVAAERHKLLAEEYASLIVATQGMVPEELVSR